MRYGIYLPSVGDYADAARLADLAQQAEAAGWEGVFIWDHIGRPAAAADPWIALTAMALRTERVRLGTIVTPLARRRPWKLARETVTLDHLSQGRLTLGVGLGGGRGEFEAFGEEGDPVLRAHKLDEALDVLTGLWRGERFTYQGTHYRLQDVQFTPCPRQTPRIPIWCCGAWPAKKAPFRRAARWDGVVAISDANRAIYPDEVAAVKAYIAQPRDQPAPFDIVVLLWSEGDGSEAEHAETAAYAAAGVTWWLEDLPPDRFSLPAAQERIRRGPPR